MGLFNSLIQSISQLNNLKAIYRFILNIHGVQELTELKAALQKAQLKNVPVSGATRYKVGVIQKFLRVS